MRKILAISMSAVVLGAIAAPAWAITALGTDLAAANTSLGVAVTSRAAFTGDLVELGADSSDPATANLPGADLQKASIEVLDPSLLRFRIHISNEAPMFFAIPEYTTYIWEGVVTSPGKTSSFSVRAMRSGQVNNPGSTDPFFELQNCEPDETTGTTTCSTSEVLTGSMASGVVSFDVPTRSIGAIPASTISTTTLSSNASVAGGVWYTNGNGGDTMTVADLTLPAVSVSYGIAPAGTPDGEVPLTVTAKANSTFRSFSGLIPRPGAGAYRIVARSCYDTVCHLQGIDYTQP